MFFAHSRSTCSLVLFKEEGKSQEVLKFTVGRHCKQEIQRITAVLRSAGTSSHHLVQDIAQAQPLREDCTEPQPGDFWRSPRRKTPQPLWANKKCSSPFVTTVALCWTLSSTSMSLLHQELKAGHSTLGEASQMHARERINTFSLLETLQPKDTLLSHGHLDVYQELQFLLCKTTTQLASPQHVLVHMGSFLFLTCKTLHFSLLNFMPTLKKLFINLQAKQVTANIFSSASQM